ncbi:hypothetical protein B0H11DRAFT_820135 [Mycena galericulata]|nr:hypothetical protein B0H11DRAFT_820135 [Mycena galericulata]
MCVRRPPTRTRPRWPDPRRPAHQRSVVCICVRGLRLRPRRRPWSVVCLCLCASSASASAVCGLPLHPRPHPRRVRICGLRRGLPLPLWPASGSASPSTVCVSVYGRRPHVVCGLPLPLRLVRASSASASASAVCVCVCVDGDGGCQWGARRRLGSKQT